MLFAQFLKNHRSNGEGIGVLNKSRSRIKSGGPLGSTPQGPIFTHPIL